MKFILSGIVFLFYTIGCYSQITKQSIVLDAVDGMPLSGANVMLSSSTNKGGVTDITGFFRTQVSSASDSILVSFVGYNSARFIAQNLPDTIYLLTKTIPLQGVIISADAAGKIGKGDRVATVLIGVEYGGIEISHADAPFLYAPKGRGYLSPAAFRIAFAVYSLISLWFGTCTEGLPGFSKILWSPCRTCW